MTNMEMSLPEPNFDLNMAVAALQSNNTDVRILLKVLVGQLESALGDRLVVERPKSGMFRRSSDEISAVRATIGDDVLEAVVDGARLRCTIGHTSGGIRIRSERVEVAEWIRRLLTALSEEASHSETTRVALERILIEGQG